MNDYSVVSLIGSECCELASNSDQLSTIKNLRRKVGNMHAKHVLATLLRALVFSGLLFLGLEVVESSWGNTLAITACFLLVHTLLFSIKGHWTISRFRKAKLYWLQDHSAEQDNSPVYLHAQAPVSKQKAV
jgi:hypothetical protein